MDAPARLVGDASANAGTSGRPLSRPSRNALLRRGPGLQSCSRASRAPAHTSCSLSWDAPKFEAAKLSVRYVGGSPPPPPGNSALGGARRRYTLTHNDLTGALLLSVGSEFNAEQVGGWYTRFLRDEILAEWAAGALHVHCHVRGTADWWLAPRQLRGFIFRREMPLVLDTVRFADREFMSQHAELAHAPVFVHFHDRDAHIVECWGSLSESTLMRGRPLTAASLRDAMLESPQVDACAADDECVTAAAADVADGAAADEHAPQLAPARADAPQSAPQPLSGSRFDTALLPAATPALRQLAAVGAAAQRSRAPQSRDEVLVGSWVRHGRTLDTY